MIMEAIMSVVNSDYPKKVYEIAKSKGLWTDETTRAEKVMWMIMELSEAVEAYKLDDFQKKLPDFKEWKESGPFKHISDDSAWEQYFVTYVKNQLECEIGDAIGILLSFSLHFDEHLYVRDVRTVFSGNMPTDILVLVQQIIAAHQRQPGRDWGYALFSIFHFCKHYKIDILWYMEQKTKYNAMRSFMHDKLH